MKATVIERNAYFLFNSQSFVKEWEDAFQKGFILKIRLKTLPDEEKKVLFQVGGFELSFVRKKATEETAFTYTEQMDRVWLYQDKEGYVSLLEMKASFLSPYENTAREMVCDLVLTLFDAEKKEVYFVYDGMRFFWVYDGKIANADYPFGTPVLDKKIYIDNHAIEYGIASLSAMKEEEREEQVKKNMAFYSPSGYNCWAGDVINFYKDGVYHLIYFYDRHHHGSRFGSGAHTLRHLTTKDFIHWQEHKKFIPLDEPWKTVGTGTMFFHKGKYYFSHGFHTSRTVPPEKTGSALLRERGAEEIIAGVTYAELREKELIPSGANYVVSDDGIHFEAGNYQFHVAENPSVYAETDGTLTMYAGYGGKGIWKADDIQGPWRKSGDFEMDASPLKPSTECPSRFALNGYTYLLVGGTGFWKTEKDGTVFKDEAANGYDIYDGMFVPMVTKTEDDRLIYGGWFRCHEWGSIIAHRELIQGENGRLFMRWLPELAPKTEELQKVNGFEMEERTSYYFEADIQPKKGGKVGLRFHGNKDCILLLDSEKERIQISGIEKEERYPQEILPLYVQAQTKEGISYKSDIWGDFTLGRAELLKEKYRLRVIIYYEPKFDSYVIDAEIGKKRTLISNRMGAGLRSLSWIAENAELQNATLYKIQ